MGLITLHNNLSEVILSQPDIIPVINRFGIMLGTSDKSIEEICREKGLNADFFLSILNTYMYEEYFPETILGTFQASTIVEYLHKTNDYQLQFMLPNIERHFNLLMSYSGNNNNLGLMRKFFDEVKSDMTLRIKFDHEQWFPLVLSLEKGDCSPTAPDFPMESPLMEDKINDLKNMFVMHLSGSYDSNLCYGVIVAIIALEKDFKQNNRIRDRILMRLYEKMTSKCS